MQRRAVRLALLVLAVGVGGVAGCEEEYVDDKRGVLDLAPFYSARATRTGADTSQDPGSVPEQISAQVGYIDGKVAELYDFGRVPAALDPLSGEPVAVRTAPMYFFYDEQDRPLFSRPVRELREGIDWIKGGSRLLNPNPKDWCAAANADPVACAEANGREKKRAYPQRTREPVIDPNRGTADYQRPVIDLTPEDNSPPRAQYTGFWEVMEVKVPGKYTPDDIKTMATLQKAISSGKFRVRSTGKVINCPIVDERTHVSRGITHRRIFRPRIELWYRGLLATCFLANGWETLGNADGAVLFSGKDSDRVDTFDVARIGLGQGANAALDLVVPIGRSYVPALLSDDQSGEGTPTITRVANNLMGIAAPRQTVVDAPGYTPAQWLFDVPAASSYESGAWKSVKDFNLSTATPRVAGGNPWVANIAVRGVAQRCSFKPDEFTTPTGRKVQRCGRLVQDPNKPPGNNIYDAKGNPACNAERDPLNPNDLPLECNPDTCFCDAPIVKYGQACGPGLARCSQEKDAFSEFGYECFPPWGGYCQMYCQGSNTLAERNVGKDVTAWVDSRCLAPTNSAVPADQKGEPIPGFVCFGGIGCVKMCDQNVSDPAQCKAEVKFSSGVRDIQEGQTCQDFGLHVCAWPDSFTPLDLPVPK